MAKIFPIKGIMYDVKQDDNLGKYLCPPFDVVDIEDIERLYESSKYNVIRLENGKSFNSDDEKENKYTRASKFFNEWISSNILKKEDNESLFILQEIFKNGEEELIRCSLICNVKVENYENKIIFPHEKTRKKQKEDRFKLMNEAKAVFSPIMSMIEDKDQELDKFLKKETKSLPFRSGEIPFMHKFNLWKIDEKEKIDFISSIFEKEKIFIADGHHRYETSINYKEFNPSVDKRIMNIFSSYDEGLLLFGYSRAIKNLDKKKLSNLVSEIFEKFSVKELVWSESILDWNQSVDQSFIMGYENKFYVLDKNDKLISTYEKIHSIFDNVIGKNDAPNHIEYIHDNHILKEKSENNDIQLSFFMNALSKEYFLNCVSQGKLLPPKSTLFYPKLPTGLVIQYFDE